MGRWVFLFAAVGLVIAACGGGETAESTTSTSDAPTTTTVVTTSATTEAPVEACEQPLEGRGRIWEAGCTYTASSFLVPITFSGAEGWTSLGAGDKWVALKYDANGDGGADATLTIFVYKEDSDPEVILDEILSLDGVNPVSDKATIALAGAPGITVDVTADEKIPLQSYSDGCTQPGGTAFFFQTTPGYVLFQVPAGGGPGSFGIPACYQSRVWVFDVGGDSITAIGVTPETDAFDEYMPILEEFLDSNVTFGDVDG